MTKARIDLERIIALYTESHLTMEEIGKIFSITRQAVYKHLKKAEVAAPQGTQVRGTCEYCGERYSIHRSRWRKGRKHFCKQDCYNKALHNPNYIPWRQGGRIARLAIIKHFWMKPGNVIHHVDGNERNNDIDNLWVFASQADHMAWHRGNREIKPIWEGKQERGWITL